MSNVEQLNLFDCRAENLQDSLFPQSASEQGCTPLNVSLERWAYPNRFHTFREENATLDNSLEDHPAIISNQRQSYIPVQPHDTTTHRLQSHHTGLTDDGSSR